MGRAVERRARVGRIAVKRVYETPERVDGMRVLVDRVWPRGLSKNKAHIGRWLKDVAPSTTLRKWFGHDLERWPEFRRRYFRELDSRPEPVAELRALARRGRVTLLFGARDTEHNNAMALKQYLLRRF